MTDSIPPRSLSSTYWELHRNTLLFSALLLIICIPGAKPATTQSFLWLSFSDVAFNNLRLIVACAATYAFITYLLEWWSEAYILLREENDLATSSRARLDQLVLNAGAAVSPSLSAFRQVIGSTSGHLTINHDIGVVYESSEIAAIVESSYEEVAGISPLVSAPPMYKMHKELMYLTGTDQKLTIDNITPIAQNAIRSMSIRVAHLSATKVNNNNTLALEGYLEKATESCINLQEALDLLSDSKYGLLQLVKSAKRSIYMYRSRSYLRVVVIGLAVPVLVFTTALAHLGGQIGIAHAPSVFSLMQNPNGAPQKMGAVRRAGRLRCAGAPTACPITPASSSVQ